MTRISGTTAVLLLILAACSAASETGSTTDAGPATTTLLATTTTTAPEPTPETTSTSFDPTTSLPAPTTTVAAESTTTTTLAPIAEANPPEVETWWCDAIDRAVVAGVEPDDFAMDFIDELRHGYTDGPAESVEAAADQLARVRCDPGYAMSVAGSLVG